MSTSKHRTRCRGRPRRSVRDNATSKSDNQQQQLPQLPQQMVASNKSRRTSSRISKANSMRNLKSNVSHGSSILDITEITSRRRVKSRSHSNETLTISSSSSLDEVEIESVDVLLSRAKEHLILDVLSRPCRVKVDRLPIDDRQGTFRIVGSSLIRVVVDLEKKPKSQLIETAKSTTTEKSHKPPVVLTKRRVRANHIELSNKIPVLRIPKLSKETLSKLSGPSRTKSKKRPVLIDKQIADFYAQKKKTEIQKNNHEDNYVLTDLESEVDDDDENDNENDEVNLSLSRGKHIPLWARKSTILTGSMQQSMSSLNLTSLFRSSAVKLPVDLTKVLKKSFK